MKTKTKKPVPTKRTGSRVKSPATTGKSVLPAWVIGAYDGPSDGRLSSRKAYSE